MAQVFDLVTSTRHSGVAVLAFNQPAVMNAVSPALIADAMAALDGIAADAAIRALILTGTGKAFCAGANLNEVGDTTGRRAADRYVAAMLESVYHPFLKRLRDLPLPIVMAVNGAAVGIGLSIALHGDLILAAQSAYFAAGFARIGLVPDGGSTFLLPRLVGLARARELALLAENLPAQKALDWGLINGVVADDQLMERALALAQRLAQGPASLALTRKLFWGADYDAQLQREQTAQQAASRTDDFREGLAAFQQKRPPRFTGK